MHESSLVLKQDVLGRVRATAQRRSEVVAEFRRSGLSGYRFARLAGMKYPTLMTWLKRHGESAGEAPAGRVAAPLLLEAEVARDAREIPPLVLRLGGGVSIELTDGAQTELAARLIRALSELERESRSC